MSVGHITTRLTPTLSLREPGFLVRFAYGKEAGWMVA